MGRMGEAGSSLLSPSGPGSGDFSWGSMLRSFLQDLGLERLLAKQPLEFAQLPLKGRVSGGGSDLLSRWRMLSR